MIPEFTLGLMKTSLKHFLDIEPVVFDSMLAQLVTRAAAGRELVGQLLTSLVSRVESVPHAVSCIWSSASSALRFGANA